METLKRLRYQVREDESHQTRQCWKKFHENFVVHCRSHYSQEFLSIQYITIYSYMLFFVVILITVDVANSSHFSDTVWHVHIILSSRGRLQYIEKKCAYYVCIYIYIYLHCYMIQYDTYSLQFITCSQLYSGVTSAFFCNHPGWSPRRKKSSRTLLGYDECIYHN